MFGVDVPDAVLDVDPEDCSWGAEGSLSCCADMDTLRDAGVCGVRLGSLDCKAAWGRACASLRALRLREGGNSSADVSM